MSFTNIDPVAFKKYLEELKNSTYKELINKMISCPGCKSNKDIVKNSTCNKTNCSDCSDGDDCCKNKKQERDGCLCRKCNEFQPLVDSDGDDGKCLCYGCKYPWGK